MWSASDEGLAIVTRLPISGSAGTGRIRASGSTSGATISSAMTTQKPIQKTAAWLNFVLGDIDLLSGALVIWASERKGRSAGTGA
jgi:hypothetical protein